MKRREVRKIRHKWHLVIMIIDTIKYLTYFFTFIKDLLACAWFLLIVILIMAAVYHRGLKRYYIDDEIDLTSPKKVKRLRDYHQQEFKQSVYDWSLQYRNKIKRNKEREKETEKEYHCYAYLKLYPTTRKCTLDVVVKSTNDIIDDTDSILLAKTRIAKVVKPGRTLN